MKKRQGGYLSLDLVLAGSAVAMIMSAGVSTYIGKLNQQRIAQSIIDARACAVTAEHFRHQETSSSVDANGVYQYTYGTQASYTGVASLTAATGKPLPTSTFWATSYQWRAPASSPASCQFQMPASVTWVDFQNEAGVTWVLAGGNYTITVYPLQRSAGPASAYARGVRGTLYQESVR